MSERLDDEEASVDQQLQEILEAVSLAQGVLGGQFVVFHRIEFPEAMFVKERQSAATQLEQANRMAEAAVTALRELQEKLSRPPLQVVPVPRSD